MNIKERLEAVMLHFGWSRAQFAREAGVSRQAVNNWLYHGHQPAYLALRRLKEKHKINDKFIRDGIGPIVSNSQDDDTELLAIFQLLRDHPNEEVRSRFLRMAKAFLDE